MFPPLSVPWPPIDDAARINPALDSTQGLVDLTVEMFHDVGGPQTPP